MPAAPQVSVVVPVHDPGANMDDLLRSLDAQTLPRERFEAVLVDDGSTDGTGQRLDAWAADRPWVRVEHIPNSGWPGTPRNVGTDLARGDYVLYVDNDDWLEPDGLEHLLARAVADDADVVIPKTVGHGKLVPRAVFRADRRDVGLDWPPLLRLLSPHKLFRRALLTEHGIRFPDGRVRLEDHLFVMHAYFHARRISVLAEHPVYHWVLRPGDNASASFDPPAYYRDLRRVLDLVEEHTEPGELRDHLLSHWLRSKVVKRAGGSNLLDRPPAEQEAVVRELREVVRERFPERFDDRLWLPFRIRLALLRRGDLEALRTFAAVERDVRAVATHADAEPEGDDLLLHLETRLLVGDEPLRLREAGGRLAWDPPARVTAVLEGLDLDVTRDREDDWLDVLGRSIGRRTEVVLDVARDVRLEPLADGGVTVVLAGAARLTAGGPQRLARGGHVVVAVPRIAGFAPPATRVVDAAGDLAVVVEGGSVRVRSPWRRTAAKRAPRLVGGARRLAGRLRGDA